MPNVREKDISSAKRVVRLTHDKNKTNSVLELNLSTIDEVGFQIIRQYGTDVLKFERDLDLISGGQLFFSNRIEALCHQYSVLPESDNLSEQLLCGGFHTDFMFQPKPPAYIALLCLKPDPRHPLYGRNQVVKMQPFLERMEQAFGLSEQDLKEHNVIYDLAEHGRFERPILDVLDGKTIFRFHELLATKTSSSETLISGVSMSAMLHAVMMDVASDICLDRGDVLIVSNHHALHRRGECSIEFDNNTGKWRSREMASIRFNL